MTRGPGDLVLGKVIRSFLGKFPFYFLFLEHLLMGIRFPGPSSLAVLSFLPHILEDSIILLSVSTEI